MVNFCNSLLRIYCTITLIVLLLKDINYELYIINWSQIAIMRVTYCYKMFIFITIAILLLIDNTNLAKADNYGSYEYPGYECHYFSKREIRDMIELIEAKCYSKAEITDLITENPCQNGHPSSTNISYFWPRQITFTTKIDWT